MGAGKAGPLVEIAVLNSLARRCVFCYIPGVSRRLVFCFIASLLSLSPALSQTILREYWLGLPGSAVGDLTNATVYPDSPGGREFSESFEGPTDWADEYGTRFRGYVRPPASGTYVFWIAGDDQCELYLSLDENPANKRRIARVATWTGSRVWEEPRDGNNLVQKSGNITLAANRRYYIEAVQKEGTGGDNIAVGWRLPNGVLERPIPGIRLEPFQVSTTPPNISGEPADVTVSEGAEARFTVVADGMLPLEFQWQRDGVDLPIERSPTLILPVAQRRDSGAKYRCFIRNSMGSALSREATLTVNPESVPPVLISILPAQGALVRDLRQVEILFSEPVDGVEASDLLVNDVPASEVSGAAAGPYIFRFPPASPGAVTLRFASKHGIVDLSEIQNPFAGATWSSVVNPNVETPKLRISEINASNETGLADEDGEREDWIELQNFGATDVSLGGWALSDSRGTPGMWIFPNVVLRAGQRMVVFASGKDRRAAGKTLHTNFLLSGSGEFLGLFDGSSPRELISGFDEYPEQRVDISFGYDSQDALKYFTTPTPNAPNGTSSILGVMPRPHFSQERGFYASPFQVYLTTEIPGAEVRFTTNGGDPSGSAGIPYTNAINIAATTILRASVWKTNYLPSEPVTHTYFYNIAVNRRSLPAISIVTATNNLTGPTGIIGIGGGTFGGDGTWQPVRAGDYHNPSKHGLAWERPTSIEFFSPSNNVQFDSICGLRVQGSDYIRPRYTPSSKFSYRFYFRGDYGRGKLEFPLFDAPITSFDQLVMRAGHNDEVNPFIKDEMMRRLFTDCGQVGSHGIFLTLFLNGVYKGYYNLTERIEKHFVQAWHGSDLEWDVMEQNNVPIDGDAVNFNSMVTFFRTSPMTNSANYLAGMRRLDLTNFVDYLLVNIYGANGDWPGNNWRAARERSDKGIWRFYMWDAEFALGTYGRGPTWDTFANELTQGSEIPSIYQALKKSPEFNLFFADRVNKHYYNGGALSDSNVTRNFTQLRSQMTNIISGFDNYILNTWIPSRRRTVTNHFRAQGLAGAPGAPTFNQFGGRVPAGFQLAMATTATGPAVSIHYTTDGTDPRVMFTGAVSPKARTYSGPVALNETTLIKARMRTNSAWSALTEATFEVSQFGAAVRFTEVMYNPPGGDAYEFIELKNFSGAPVDLGGMQFEGVGYRFPEPTILAGGTTIVIASGAGTNNFALRYPNLIVSGYFENSLNNGGEHLLLKDKRGNIVASVDYDDERGWPLEADGLGYSLELVDREADPNSATAWRRSRSIYGSPGVVESVEGQGIVLSEIVPASEGAPAWIELHNPTASEVNLGNYALGDLGSNRRYVFSNTASIAPGGYYAQSGFPIGLGGGTVFLADANTNRIDAVAYGRMLAGYSLARVAGAWTLGTPTSGAENMAAELAPFTALSLNEWLADSRPGGEDWLEIYNSSANPAALHGCTLSVSNAIYRIPAYSFIAPGGFAQLFASERVGPDHLGFKLPAAGGAIRLYDPTGTLVNSIQYGQQAEGVSEGSLPDGAPNFVRFPGSATPAASNYKPNPASSLVINEVMARNVRAVIDPGGSASDWIELYNSGADAISLDGFSLSADEPVPGQWRFPAGTVIAAGAYRLVWFDKTNPPSELNTGRSLSADGGGVYLFNGQGQVVDQIEYGMQAANLSIGRAPGFGWALLIGPSPGAANQSVAPLSAATSARINEWSAQRNSSPAWIELHNPTDLPIGMGDMSLTDELALRAQRKFVFPQLSYLGPKQFVRLTASENASAGPGEINFSISEFGESLRLYTGAAAIADTVSFGFAPTSGTLARLPDATGEPMRAVPSPGEPNYLPLAGVGISEVNSGNGSVEIRNYSGSVVDISGWRLNEYIFPMGRALPPFGKSRVFTQVDGVLGGTVTLDRSGYLEQSRLAYGPAATYKAIKTSIGIQAAPPPSPVVINEVMYSSDLEYVELVNVGNAPVPANGWRVNGGVQFNFAPDSVFPADRAVVIVPFDPQANPEMLESFHGRYRNPSNALFVGPLRGRLGNDGDSVVLERALPPAPDRYVPHLEMDRVEYSSNVPWPAGAANGALALHRIRRSEFGNEPLNWIAGAPTPGTYQEVRDAYDRDADGMWDTWEIANGFDIYDATDAVKDFDGDGLSNFDEFKAASDPLDPEIGLILGVARGDAGYLMRFNAAPNQSYRVEFRNSFTEGAWQTHSEVAAEPAARVVSIPLIEENASQRFYRVVK